MDIGFVEEKHKYFYILYFSSSRDFSKKIRLIASKKGYKLNEKGLFEKKSGKLIDFQPKSEKDIFNYLDMNYIKPDVATICMGQAASMGAFLLAGGAVGKRSALPNARIMIHQPLGGAEGQASDIKIQADEILRLRSNLNKILAKNTKQTLKKIETDTDRNFFMSSLEAKKYGLIDAVLNERK